MQQTILSWIYSGKNFWGTSITPVGLYSLHQGEHSGLWAHNLLLFCTNIILPYFSSMSSAYMLVFEESL